MMSIARLALAIFLITAPTLRAGDDFADWLAKGEKGDPAAQSEVGRRYLNGTGVAKDNALALVWFKKAAAQGQVKAEVQLGSIYAHGFGVKQDWAEAIRWFRSAALKGDTTAQHNLGLDYQHGHGVPRDAAEAARWYRKAADQGHARAQYNLGELYESGNGVPQSTLQAHLLYTLASEHENQDYIFGKAKAAEVIVKRNRTETKLTPDERKAFPRKLEAAKALIPLHPRKFGAPGMIGKSRGWYIWQKWNPLTWEAEVTHETPGEVFKVRVLPWATTYRHLAYGARFDAILPGEKINAFFDADENHRRGYLVHFQDEISQMKGHGHFWKILETPEANQFVAQVFAGDKALDDKTHPFEIDPACKKWSAGKEVQSVTLKPGDRVYLTWVLNENRRVVKLIADDASLDVLKKIETQGIGAEIAQEGLAGRIDSVDGPRVHFMVFSSYWAQSNQLKVGQSVRIAGTKAGLRPTDERLAAKVVSLKNRGMYGSGVNDVLLELVDQADADKLRARELEVQRLIPQ